MMHLTVKIKSNYGNKAVYPACAMSSQMVDLLGTKTFTSQAIAKLKAMGVQFTVEQEGL